MPPKQRRMYIPFMGCKHDMKVTERSNVLQQDEMGYPLRLVIFECVKCGESDQIWLDVPESELDELRTGKSVLLHWDKST